MWQKHICVPKICGKMGLYQYEIITKPCLINEIWPSVRANISKRVTIVSDYFVAKDKEEWKEERVNSLILTYANLTRYILCVSDFIFWKHSVSFLIKEMWKMDQTMTESNPASWKNFKFPNQLDFFFLYAELDNYGACFD